MKNKKLSKTTGITILITGIGHTFTHFSMQFRPNPHQDLLNAMENTKLNFGTEVSVLDFQNGFSIAMGILLIGLGIHILRYFDKTGTYINLGLVGLMLITAFFHFPLFVIILLSISFISLLISSIIYEN